MQSHMLTLFLLVPVDNKNRNNGYYKYYDHHCNYYSNDDTSTAIIITATSYGKYTQHTKVMCVKSNC